EEARLLELYELQRNQGPCLDCVRAGVPVAREDLPAMRASWPIFTAKMLEFGYHSAHALPMRVHNETIGALNLFRSKPGRMPEPDLWLGQATGHVATVGLMQERTIAAM